jgi:Zinc knuckle
MNANVFECYEEQSDRRQYSKTLEALESHVKKSLKYSEDLAPLFAETMATPTIAKPGEPDASATKTEEMIHVEEVKEYVKRTRTLKSNMATVYAVVWGQCSEAMKAKVKSLTGYKEKAEANDCYWLLKQVKAVTLQFDEKRNVFISLLDARTSFLNCKQKQGQSADEYLETLRGWADTIEYHGGIVAENFTLIPAKDDQGKPRTDDERKTAARDRTLAITLIRGADPTRYGTLIAELSNQYAMGKDEYPTDISSAYSLLVNYKTPANTRARDERRNLAPPATAQPTGPEASALTFSQKTSGVAGTDGIVHERITCYNCQATGHYATDCPSDGKIPAQPGTSLLQYAYMLAQAKPATGINPDWILLDSQSTISVFRNPKMLTNIRKSGRVLRALTNGGYQDSNMVGDFPNLGEVWYNSNSIANILSLAEVRKVCRVTMDTLAEPSMHVHRLNGSVMKFVEHESGLYVYDSINTSESVNAYTMVSTVAEQKKMFSRREIKAADEARVLYRKIGRPDEAEFQHILRSNFIRNCPVTPDDAKRALVIYGPDLATIKGKTTKSAAAARAPTFIATPLPAPIMEHHRNITLCFDFFFVQGVAFFHTISRNIGFRTVSHVPDRSKKTILREATAVINLYTARGLHVCDIHADNEFECIREHIRPVDMNIIPADSHVGEVERSIRTIKERLRSCVHGLPFKRLPKLMITHMVADAVRCLNQFPWKNGVSTTLSPACILTGAAVPDFNSMRLEFGTYVQVFETTTLPTPPRRDRSGRSH